MLACFVDNQVTSVKGIERRLINVSQPDVGLDSFTHGHSPIVIRWPSYLSRGCGQYRDQTVELLCTLPLHCTDPVYHAATSVPQCAFLWSLQH